jgi:hypothetical protein
MKEAIEQLLLEVQRAKFSERRTEPRQPFPRPVQVHLAQGRIVSAFAKDLSTMGIGIITNVESAVGTVAVLEIHTLTGDPVYLRSEVRWCDAYGRGWHLVGWKFLALASRPVP